MKQKTLALTALPFVSLRRDGKMSLGLSCMSSNSHLITHDYLFIYGLYKGQFFLYYHIADGLLGSKFLRYNGAGRVT
jgi:hypothetical protein